MAQNTLFFKQELEKISNGTISVKINDYGSYLKDIKDQEELNVQPKYFLDKEILEAVKSRKIEVGMISLSRFSQLIPLVDIFHQPFLLDTEKNDGLTLILAINYSGKWDIINATKKIIENKAKIDLANFNEKYFEKNLATSNIPDPELIIRTSGEKRISNFYLWQSAYSELYFTNILWPDFSKKELNNAIFEFKKRNRRFGSV